MRERALIPTLVLVTVMVSLISSLGAPLVPSIAVADAVSLSAAQWSLTLTLLVGTVATPVIGRLGDGPHRRPVLLGTLAAVLTGSLLAALPFGFVGLLLGRGLQGLGLGLLPLTMAAARDHLNPVQARSTISLLAVTGVAGVGLGYPLTGLIADHAGLHGAFWFGVALSGLALGVAYAVLPASTTRTAPPLDVMGAGVMGLGLTGLLLGLTQGSSWGWGSVWLPSVLAGSALTLTVWVLHELRTEHPLIDLRLLRHRLVRLADVTALLSGIGMYLMISLCIRLVQTPTSTGYGIGASVAVAGLILVPLSIVSLSTSRLVPILTTVVPSDRLLPLGTVVLGAGFGIFRLWHAQLWQVMVVLGVVGLGVGLIASVLPALLLRAVPSFETGSALAFNQVLRTTGYTLGSALSAVVLEAHTEAGQLLPTDHGYQVSAFAGLALSAATLLVVLALLPHQHARQPQAREANASFGGQGAGQSMAAQCARPGRVSIK